MCNTYSFLVKRSSLFHVWENFDFFLSFALHNAANISLLETRLLVLHQASPDRLARTQTPNLQATDVMPLWSNLSQIALQTGGLLSSAPFNHCLEALRREWTTHESCWDLSWTQNTPTMYRNKSLSESLKFSICSLNHCLVKDGNHPVLSGVWFRTNPYRPHRLSRDGGLAPAGNSSAFWICCNSAVQGNIFHMILPKNYSQRHFSFRYSLLDITVDLLRVCLLPVCCMYQCFSSPVTGKSCHCGSNLFICKINVKPELMIHSMPCFN